MEKQREQIEKVVFEDVRDKKVKQDDIEVLMRQFDKQFESYCEEKEEQLRQLVGEVNNKTEGLIV